MQRPATQASRDGATLRPAAPIVQPAATQAPRMRAIVSSGATNPRGLRRARGVPLFSVKSLRLADPFATQFGAADNLLSRSFRRLARQHNSAVALVIDSGAVT